MKVYTQPRCGTKRHREKGIRIGERSERKKILKSTRKQKRINFKVKHVNKNTAEH